MAQVEFEVPGPGTYLIDADPSLPALSNPGQASDVLAGEEFYDEDGNPVTGTMPNNPAEAIVIPGGGSYTIPQGYHTGQGTVTSSGSVLPTLTNPASAGEIASGKEVIDQNGAVMTGTMPSNPAISETLEAGESYQVPAGYTPGGTVQAASLASQTPGTATQDDIIQGQTAWVNGVQITGALEPGSDTSDATATAADILEGETAYVATGKVSGTMPNNGAVQETLQAGGQYTIPAGYHNGQGTVTTETLANQTQGTATAPDILNGETAWVNGAQVTGSMPNNGAVTEMLDAGETYTIPAGYHNGSGTVTAPTVASETPGTAVAGDIRQGKTAWVDGEQITGTVPDVEAATPTISVDSQTGLITAETQQVEGFVGEATKAASQQLPTQASQIITPGTTPQTIQANVYLTGAQTIQGDTNLVPENIKDGASIFGVTGTFSGDGGGEQGFAPHLIVSVDTGATVTAMNGETSLTATSVDGTADIILTKGGEWTVSATLEGQMSTVEIISVQSAYSATLTFTEISPILNDNDWSAIRNVSNSGSGQNYWAIGDCKEVTLNGTVGDLSLDNYSTYAFIIGFNHNAEVEGENRIHFQLAKTALTSGIDICFDNSSFRMNTSATNAGGWADSYMRNNICGTSLVNYSGTFIGIIPYTLRAVLKSVTKYTYNVGENAETTDYFFLLSEYEVFGRIQYSNSSEASHQQQYEYYSQGNSTIKYSYRYPDFDTPWGLRSASTSNSYRFVCVSIVGTPISNSNFNANSAISVSPGFCV